MKTIKELTAHIRTCLHAFGIKARVRIAPGCGNCIQVFPSEARATFSNDEQREIRTLAIRNGLTFVMGVKINPERMTDPFGMDFYRY